MKVRTVLQRVRTTVYCVPEKQTDFQIAFPLCWAMFSLPYQHETRVPCLLENETKVLLCRIRKITKELCALPFRAILQVSGVKGCKGKMELESMEPSEQICES
jgi:hypothetical protein